MDLPKQTGEIFELLSKGQFICSDSGDGNTRKLYYVLEENQDELRSYFQAINFVLEQGEEYFYFTRDEAKAEMERKIDIAWKWIDSLDFFKAYDNSFGPGTRFSPPDVLVRLNVDAALKSKLDGLKKYSKEDKYDDSIRKIIEMLRKDSFLELENEITGYYKVLASFKYLELLITSINIPDEVQNEIPE